MAQQTGGTTAERGGPGGQEEMRRWGQSEGGSVDSQKGKRLGIKTTASKVLGLRVGCINEAA